MPYVLFRSICLGLVAASDSAHWSLALENINLITRTGTSITVLMLRKVCSVLFWSLGALLFYGPC